ncbi:MAG TPA: haloacid dehalogenase-like hydrolase [Candidatus Acidoferrales bacterium]|nr:haloacid dehalogenase-like hydrolase [Candidatus Acidoferrales bacterium]
MSLVVDLCGTLVREDTTRAFVNSLELKGWRRAMLRLANTVLVRKVSVFLRWDLSRRTVIYALRGLTRSVLEAAAEKYVEICVSERLDPIVKAAVVSETKSGGSVFLATASLDVVATEVARRLGITGVVSSKLAYGSGERCIGRLALDLTGKKWMHLVNSFPVLLVDRPTVYTDNPEDGDLIEKATRVCFMSRPGVPVPQRFRDLAHVRVVEN